MGWIDFESLQFRGPDFAYVFAGWREARPIGTNVVTPTPQGRVTSLNKGEHNMRAVVKTQVVARIALAVMALHLAGIGPPPNAQAPLPTAGSWDSEPIVPIPLDADLDAAQVALGEKLFHDSRLSRNNAFSCATCHRLDQGGGDGVSRPPTLTGGLHLRNTPTVYNVSLNSRFHWDGGFRTLEAEAEAALHDPTVMNSNWTDVLTKLQIGSDYVSAFNAAYSDGLTRANVRHALATFQRSLITPNSRFDQYLRGDADALSDDEKRGYDLFKSYGCAACHQGVNVGGNMFQRFGIFRSRNRPHEDEDAGRFRVTGAERDRQVFRVPSLRNVAVTAPYYHDGRVQSLETAVDLMATRQLGRPLYPEEIELIVQFLHTLTGEYQGELLTLPSEDGS